MSEASDIGLTTNHAWSSLLGLISPFEYFITVDHSVLWQRHVSWAKPRGEDLRLYVTQRFASNMIVLSLMLGAQINVFFNSSAELTEMRRILGAEIYGSLKFWIGIVISLDACVTIMALVSTFILWGMISAISDTNTHALLRSSIGQYVISMPPRFVVAALYLFIMWLFLAIMDFTKGPARIVLALVIFILFFQVIIPLSVFGRLIIHTGAMDKRRILDEEFEKELLPSGLHASLLIRATGQRRRYSNVISQYQKRPKSLSSNSVATHETCNSTIPTMSMSQEETPVPSRSFRSSYEEASSVHRSTPDDSTSASGDQAHRRNSSISETESLVSEIANLPEVKYSPVSPRGTVRTRPDKHGRPLRRYRSGSGRSTFPRPSLLNAVGFSDLNGVVKKVVQENEEEEFEAERSHSEPIGMELIHTEDHPTSTSAPELADVKQEGKQSTGPHEDNNLSMLQLATAFNQSPRSPSRLAEEHAVKDVYSSEVQPTTRSSLRGSIWSLGKLSEGQEESSRTISSLAKEGSDTDGDESEGGGVSRSTKLHESEERNESSDIECGERQGLLSRSSGSDPPNYST
eukprot:Nitzschia sp. Nitz4//scaffold56_size114212//102121//103845//NITZ4_003969-RA/size114212-processed-gene-0.39-mRNA-1//-1//CDS//3329554763//7113//frame0